MTNRVSNAMKRDSINNNNSNSKVSNAMNRDSVNNNNNNNNKSKITTASSSKQRLTRDPSNKSKLTTASASNQRLTRDPSMIIWKMPKSNPIRHQHSGSLCRKKK